MPNEGGASSEHGDEQKEQHRLGTINRRDPPEGDWASDYDWTRYRGPDPWPVPGGWVFESPEAGGNWEYFGDAGVGHDDDNSILDVMEADDDVADPYGRLNEQRGERAWLNVETANPEDVSLRNPADEELKWTLQIGNVEVFSRVEPDRSDLMGAVAEALAAYHEGDLDERVDEIMPTTGRVPDDVREQQELEQREEENESLDEFVTDGGDTIDRFTELPTPDRFFMQIEPAEIEMQPMGRDDVDFRMQVVPGGSFAIVLSASYSYAGRDCIQNLSLDREGAKALHEALGKALEVDSRR